ncbi:MAG: hypothetical protein M4579_002870 [Chaenotheca gracillima]|nr:MAG: hypothetical protein M4579_002870 [Chaenotheca gracillima]
MPSATTMMEGAETATADAVAIETLSLLESRLRRLEFVVTGAAEPIHEPAEGRRKEDSIAARLEGVEHAYNKLAMESDLVQEVLQLQSQFPDAFALAPSKSSAPSMSTMEMLSVVLSSATQLSTASSDLTVIHDMPVPSAETSAALIELQPRIAKLSRAQERQAREIAVLRQRSARLLERWYEVNILEGGECWTEWDQRMMRVEREVKRAELIKAREEDEL